MKSKATFSSQVDLGESIVVASNSNKEVFSIRKTLLKVSPEENPARLGATCVGVRRHVERGAPQALSAGTADPRKLMRPLSGAAGPRAFAWVRG